MRDHIRPGFPGTVPGFSRHLARCPATFVFVSQISWACTNTTFLTMPTNILTFPRLEKMSIGIRHTATSHIEGEKDMQVSDCRVRIETSKGEEGICKCKPVSGMICVILGGILALVFSITLII